MCSRHTVILTTILFPLLMVSSAAAAVPVQWSVNVHAPIYRRTAICLVSRQKQGKYFGVPTCTVSPVRQPVLWREGIALEVNNHCIMAFNA